jgi:hypothetical protein
MIQVGDRVVALDFQDSRAGFHHRRSGQIGTAFSVHVSRDYVSIIVRFPMGEDVAFFDTEVVKVVSE